MSTAVLLPNGKQAFLNAAGTPGIGCKLQTWAAGTSNPKSTWQDAGEGAANTNPIILDARGEATVFWDGAYKVQLQDPAGAPIWTIDNVTGIYPGSASLVPTTDNAFDLGSAAFAWRNLYLGANHAALLDPTTGNIGYWARTAAEIAAAVTPTIYFFPPGDVRRYGADPTGVADSTSAYQQAANSNLQVSMSEGTWKITGQVLCTARGVTFSGIARGAVQIVLSSATDAFKWTTTPIGGGIKRCTINVTSQTGGYAVNATTGARWVAEDISVIGNSVSSAGGFYASDFNSVTFRDIWMNGNYGAAGSAIYLFGTTNSQANVADISNVQYGGSGAAAATSSVGLTIDGGVSTVNIRHFGSVNCLNGLKTLNTPGITTFAVFIEGEDLEIDGCYGDGMILGTAAGVGTSSTHNFNKLYVHNTGNNNAGVGAGNGNGIWMYQNCRGVHYQGGDILTCRLTAMTIDSNVVHISDMNIRKNSQGAVGTYPGIQLTANSYGINIHDNLIGQHTGASTSDMSYGIQIDAGSKQNIIHHNYLLANTLGPINNVALDQSSIIRDNLYAGNQTFGTATSPAAMAAAVNNYNGANWGVNVTRLRLTPAAGGTTMNGLYAGAAAAEWLDGTTVVMRNLSAVDNITLAHQNAGSNAWNRFNLAGAANLVLNPLRSVMLMYDGFESRWNAIV